ncbi:hypothetical protein C8J56DRAFT_891799 [Mycena floridula]|nr:hypothetical protein C8J56DRAFT_891799 [Mycena floridula]
MAKPFHKTQTYQGPARVIEHEPTMRALIFRSKFGLFLVDHLLGIIGACQTFKACRRPSKYLADLLLTVNGLRHSGSFAVMTPRTQQSLHQSYLPWYSESWLKNGDSYLPPKVGLYPTGRVRDKGTPGTQDRKNAWKRGEREQNMACQAMSDVQAGRSSIRQTAQGHQVTPLLLLGYRLNGRKERHGAHEAQRALSGAEEDELVTLDGGAGQLGCPFTINLRPRLVIGDCNKDNSHISRKCVIHEPQDDDTRPRNNLNVQSSPQTV